MTNYLNHIKKSDNIIVQVGANDGIVGEEYGFVELIRDTSNIVYMIEPVPMYMEVLKDVSKDYRSKIEYIQCGIRNYNGVGSISVDGGMSSFVFNTSSCPKITVPVQTFSSLFISRCITDIDLLLLDVEGCELELVESIPFDIVRIGVIRWEYHNLSSKDNIKICQILQSNGYDVDYCSHDPKHNMVAFKNGVSNVFTE